jgi:feruloyl esterase
MKTHSAPSGFHWTSSSDGVNVKVESRLSVALISVGLMMFAVAGAAAAGTAEAASDCTVERIASMAGPSIRIESAATVAAQAPVPAYCAISGFIEHNTRIGFSLGLPREWNRKFLFLGVGGFAGVPAPLQGGIARGYATASTDTGHQAASVEEASWALNNPAGILNHYESSVELAAVMLKELISAWYGARPLHAYFQGCSAGGRQAVVQAERFPDSFDGIVAEAPAWSYSRLLVSFIENGQEILKSPANWIAPGAFAEIDRVVMAQCDALDGVQDGIIEDPRACKPDLGKLLCSTRPNGSAGGQGAVCLTPAQLGMLRKLVSPVFARGHSGFYGYPLSGSDRGDASWGWSEWFFGTLPPVPDRSGKLNFRGDVLPEGADRGKGPNQFLLGERFFRYMVMNDPEYDARTFQLTRDMPHLQERLGAVLDADDTDLGPYIRSGGKLLIWHGWSDPAIPPSMAIELYTRILQDTRRQLGQSPTAEAVRLFMVPGVQHCGGGNGLTDFDPLAAMEDWVEHGQAPDRITAWQRVEGKRVRSRPLCPYPKTPRYQGSGNPDEAANFDCK